MSLSVERINDTFVGEVDGVKLSDDHSDGEIGDIRSALMKHGILVFHGQNMSNQQHVRFSQKFGPSEIHTVKPYLLEGFPEIIALANRGDKGTKPIANGGAYWHSDITYKVRPPMGSILYALEIPPEGGDTLYCDMAGAYDALSDEMKAELAEVVHPIVRTHPENGRKALFINEGFTVRVEDMDENDGKALLSE